MKKPYILLFLVLSQLTFAKPFVVSSEELVSLSKNIFYTTFINDLTNETVATSKTAVVVIADNIFTGDITVTTQAEVDALPALKYTHITGRLNILGGDISDLSKFSLLRDIGKRLLIQDCSSLTDLTGLSALEAIGSLGTTEEFLVRRNAGLTTLNGLQALTSVGRRVGIRQNPDLTTLEGLNNLVTIGTNVLTIGGESGQGNALLTNFCALSGIITSIGAAVLEANASSYINNETLFDPSFEEITDGTCSIVSGAQIVGLEARTSSITETDTDQTVMIAVTMTNYDGSPVDISVTATGTAAGADYTLNTTSLSFTADGSQNISLTLKDDVDIIDETVILTLAETTATGITVSASKHTVSIADDETADVTFTGDLTVETQADVDALPAIKYTHITGRLNILSGDISDLSKFSELREIGRRLLIQDSPSITDLTGLSALENIGNLDTSSEVLIRRMDGLTTLNGLQSLTSVVRRFAVRENDALTTLEGLNNLVTITGTKTLTIGGTGDGNASLTNFCALSGVISSIGAAVLEADANSFITNETLFNPTFAEIVAGTCEAAPLSISEFSKGSYNMYPNPVSDVLTIETNEKLDFVKVITTLGAEVLSSKENQIDLSNLSSGLYYIKIISGNKEAVEKIIKH
tara:strand:+ start:50136 stop:52052 length:1917 start_codon:yes stop_codon:yes gene_type:complete